MVPYCKMLLKPSRSASVLESSMLLNIQQPFSKLENTILIPTSPEKVKAVQSQNIHDVCRTSHTHMHAFMSNLLSQAVVLLTVVSDGRRTRLVVSSFVQTHMIRLFSLIESGK